VASRRYIIIGDGAAGTTAAEAIRAADASAMIAILSDDPHAAYYRAALTNFLLGELREEQIWAVPPSFYDELSIQRALVRVAKIDVAQRQIWLAQGGRPIPYDRLLIAAGARARPPTFAGSLLPGVMVMRTLIDVHRVFDLIKLRGLRSAVICGGGPLAMEWAHGLVHRGVNVTMVVRDRRFLPGAIDNVANDLLLARLRQGGVGVRMGDEVTQVLPGPAGHVAGAVLKSGERLPCELVGVAFGVICNSEFLQGSPVAIAKNGGVLTDDRMSTNVPGICAAGDIAAVNGNLLQLWEPARHQAKVAAATLLGAEARYAPGVHYMATRLYDLDVASIGEVAQTPPGAEDLVDFPQRTGQISYKKLCIREGRVVGALLFGERVAAVRRHGRAFKKLIDSKADITAIKSQLLDAAFDLSGWLRKQELTEKPKVAAKAMTLASAGRIKGTHAINLADLPPLPGTPNAKAAAGSGSATALSIPSVPAPMTEQAPPPKVRLEASFGFIEVTTSSTIGRNPQAPVPLNDPGVSWTHAEIVVSGQSVYVRDLGSATGTWVNGAPVTAPKRLKDGARIRVGSTDLVVRIESSMADMAHPSLLPPVASQQGEPQPHLDVLTGNSLGLSFQLVQAQEVIGRDPRCNIRLDDEWIDAQHAFVRKTAAGWELADAESRGVTKKNGQVLAPNQWVPLAAGDSIEVGAVKMSFAMRAALDLAGFNYDPASAVRASALPPVAISYGPGGLAPMSRQSYPMSGPPSPPVSMTRRARLSVRRGPNVGSTAELADVTVIGSMTGAATLVLTDPHVGPQHVEITRRPDGFYARDLGAPAGTACRGQRLGPQPIQLASGDLLFLGPSVELLFEVAP
jgi:NADPH-dependent 2,4-dienoyl-CoA reductase/sulfur reductase-like enzyme/pSer/pThr/pTyr-binding forkhead associated (FHA) protein